MTDNGIRIQVIPKINHGRNLRTLLPECIWDMIRFYTYQKARNRCEVCSSPTNIEAHEEWRIKGKSQKLVKVTCLCKMCHEGTHILRAVRYSPNAINIKKHIKAINNWDDNKLSSEIARAASLFNDYITRGPIEININYVVNILTEIRKSSLNITDITEII